MGSRQTMKTASPRIPVALIAAFLVLAGAVPAKTLTLSEGGTELIDAKPGTFRYGGKKGLATIETVAVSGMPFEQALASSSRSTLKGQLTSWPS